jgi:hypothetical protein
MYPYGVDNYFSGPGMAQEMLDHILHFPPGETLMFISGKGDSKKVLHSLYSSYFFKNKNVPLPSHMKDEKSQTQF